MNGRPGKEESNHESGEILDHFERLISLNQVDQLNQLLKNNRISAIISLNIKLPFEIFIMQLEAFGLHKHARKFILAEEIQRAFGERNAELLNDVSTKVSPLNAYDINFLTLIFDQSEVDSTEYFGHEETADFSAAKMTLLKAMQTANNRLIFAGSEFDQYSDGTPVVEAMTEEEQLAHAMKLSMNIHKENEIAPSPQGASGEKEVVGENPGDKLSDYEKFKKLCASRKPTKQPDALISLFLTHHQKCLAIQNDKRFNFAELIEELTRLKLTEQLQKFRIAENIKIAFDKRNAELMRQCTQEFLLLQPNKEDLLFFHFTLQGAKKTTREVDNFDRCAELLENILKGFCELTRAFVPQEPSCLPNMDDEKIRKLLLPAKRDLSSIFAFFRTASIRSVTDKTPLLHENKDQDIQETILLSLQTQAAENAVLFKSAGKKTNHRQQETSTESEKKSTGWRHRSV